MKLFPVKVITNISVSRNLNVRRTTHKHTHTHTHTHIHTHKRDEEMNVLMRGLFPRVGAVVGASASVLPRARVSLGLGSSTGMLGVPQFFQTAQLSKYISRARTKRLPLTTKR
jgi:hypothetical protein